MSDPTEHVWQHRVIDLPSDIDYTQNKVGEEVVVETMTLLECPGCHRPGTPFGLEDVNGDTWLAFTHRRQKGGQPTEVCIAQPKGSPKYIVMDSEGNKTYAGPGPKSKQ
jgi:hypothetical protein